MKKIILLSAVFIAMLTGCKKETGPVGPTGPQGPQGIQGNANVHSYSFAAAPNNWNTTSSPPAYFVSLSVPELTSEIMNSGAVLVYMQVAGNTNYTQLPVTSYVSSGYSETFEVSNTVGVVKVFRSNSSLTLPPALTTNVTFKVIVIAAGLEAANGIDLSNYTTVKERWNLSE